MSGLQMADFFVTMLQGFLLSNLICKLYRLKYNYYLTVIINMVVLELLYFVMNYAIIDIVRRFILGIICFGLLGYFIFQGSAMSRLIKGMSEYLIFVGLDVVVMIVVLEWLGLSMHDDIFISLRLLLARNCYNVTIYLLITFVELWKQHTEGKYFKTVAYVSVSFSLCQLFIMKNVYQANAVGLTESAVTISVFYSGMVILSYFVVIELFRQTVRQGQKQSELEQMALERQYQYDYYQKAYKQSEQIRDLRHDMRNQLQAVECLLVTGIEDDKKRAHRMLQELYGEMEKERGM